MNWRVFARRLVMLLARRSGPRRASWRP